MHISSRYRLALAGLTLGLTSACFTNNSYVTGETLPKGEGLVAGGFGWLQLESASFEQRDADGDVVDSDEQDDINLNLPFLLAMGRLGVTDDFEVGAQAYTLGLRLDAKYAFIQPEILTPATGESHELDSRYVQRSWQRDNGFALAIDPTVAWSSLIVVSKVDFELPLVLSYRFTDNFQLFGSVRGGYSRWICSGGDEDCDDSVQNANYFSYGGSLGLSIDGSVFFMRPEVGFYQLRGWRNEVVDSDTGEKTTFESTLNTIQPGLVFGFRMR